VGWVYTLTNALTSNISVTSYLSNLHLKKRQLPLVIVGFFILFIAKAQAQQLSFSKTQVEQSYNFQYQWLDHNKTVQAINFTLNKEGLFERFRDFKAYQTSYAQKTILRRIKKKMQKNPIPGVQVFYRQQQNRFLIEVKGLDKNKVAEAYQTLARLEHEVTQKYLKDSYYQAVTNH